MAAVAEGAEASAAAFQLLASAAAAASSASAAAARAEACAAALAREQDATARALEAAVEAKEGTERDLYARVRPFPARRVQLTFFSSRWC